MAKFINNQEFSNFLIFDIFDQDLNKLLILGIFLIVIGIFLSVSSIVLMKKSKRNSDLLLDNVIREEVEKSSINNDDNNIDDQTLESEVVNSELLKEDLKVEINDISKDDVVYNEKVIVNENGEIDNIIISSNLTNDNEEIEPVKITDKEITMSDDVSIPEIEIVDIEEPENDVDDYTFDNKDEEPEIIIQESVGSSEDVLEDEEIKDVEYVEMDEEDSNEIIVNKNIDIQMPESVEVKITTPKKGKDIEVDLNTSEEEEIELL